MRNRDQQRERSQNDRSGGEPRWGDGRSNDASRWGMNDPALRSSRDDERTWRDDWRPERHSARPMRRQGPHAGKGPKGYTRSDERIREEVSDALMDDGRIDASEIEVDVTSGQVTLRGTVDSRETKRAAEDVVDGVSGVHDVQNMLRVETRGQEDRAEDRPEQGRSSGTGSSRSAETRSRSTSSSSTGSNSTSPNSSRSSGKTEHHKRKTSSTRSGRHR